MLEARWFVLVDRLAAFECRRRGLRPEDAEEFRGYARLRMAEKGDAILAAHARRSDVEVYLLVVVGRMLRDWQRAEWGSWRPSAEALRLGSVAVALEQRWVRDGEPFDRVASELLSRFGDRASSGELERIRRRLPDRARRRRVGAEELSALPAAETRAEAALNAREAAEIAGRLGPLVVTALRALEALDRLLLALVFRDGMSVRSAARAVGLEHKNAGRRLGRVLEELRRAVERGGVDRHGILLLLEFPLDAAGDWLDSSGDTEWDKPPARPSSPGADK